MQTRTPRPAVRAVRREIQPHRPKRGWRRVGMRLRALFLVAVVASGAWYGWQQVRAPVVQPVVAVRHGVVEEALEVDALLVRREQVVSAPVAGQVRRLAPEGERVRVGATVVEIGPQSQAAAPSHSAPVQPIAAAVSAARREYDRLSGEIYQLAAALNEVKSAGQTERAGAMQSELDSLSLRQSALLGHLERSAERPVTSTPSATPVTSPGATEVTTEVAGIVLYQTDGLEGVLRSGDLSAWTPSWVRALPFPDLNETGREQIVPGQPLFKVVDDLNLEMLVLLPAGRLTPSQRTILAQEGVALRLAGRDRPLNAHLRRIVAEGEELLLHLTIPLPAAEALRVRRLRITLLLETFEGTILPRVAIDVQNGETGVWVQDGGRYHFTPVRVLGGNQLEVAVAGELAPDARVLTTVPPPGR